jgi:hypothetical protein
LGSGSTVIAAQRTGRDGIGYDLDPSYVALARARVAHERAVADESDGDRIDDGGAAVATVAKQALAEAGFTDVRANRRLRGLGLSVSFTAEDVGGRTWYFDVAGVNSSYRGGMGKADTVWRTLGRAHVMASNDVAPFVVLTTQLPRPGTEVDRALRACGPGGFFDAVDLLSVSARARLGAYARRAAATPLPGFWTQSDLAPGAV